MTPTKWWVSPMKVIDHLLKGVSVALFHSDCASHAAGLLGVAAGLT